MAIERDEHGNVTITGDDINLYRIRVLIGMLKLEVKSNGALKASSKGSPFQQLKLAGVIPANIRTKKEGLEIAQAFWDGVMGKNTEKNNGTAE